ncbi:Uncharacterised protein [Serratia fonticola]|uniref:hypothetical protein n=1 Tax=Serratia fonticola TaxID=47917 RepID=UPI0021791792|nr:hypothetical protein [Serratia fonticola]CAI2031291.1 Uncharacterised protein [Serratia fonticola]
MICKPGFIRNPWTKQRGDSIQAAAVIREFSHAAHRGCGLHYEIYHYRLICELRALLEGLDSADRQTLTAEAARQGFQLDDASAHESGQAYRNTLKEIREEQC